MLLAAYRFYFGAVGYGPIFKSVFHMLPALLSLAGLCTFGYQFLIDLIGAPLVAVAVTIGLSVPLYFGINQVFRHPDAEPVIGIFKRRFKNAKAKER